MSKYAAVLEKVSPPTDLSVVRAPRHNRYAELATRLFEATPRRTVVAFAAVHHGEGVTRTVRGLADELIRSGKRVAVDFENSPLILGAPIKDEPGLILLDCGSLETPVDLLRLAPLSDGVVIVVEAGRTSKEQLDRAAQVVREAQGTLIGFVLNKRRYPIPGWLHRML